jgi:hypothetical protein
LTLKTRAVEIAGITCHPNERWMTQLARNLVDAIGWTASSTGQPVRAFVAHYHEERLHQGLANKRLAPTTPSTGFGPIPVPPTRSRNSLRACCSDGT